MSDISTSASLRGVGVRATQGGGTPGNGSPHPSAQPVQASAPADTDAFSLSPSLRSLSDNGVYAALVASGDERSILLLLADGRQFRLRDPTLQIGQRLLLNFVGEVDGVVKALLIEVNGAKLAAPRELRLKLEGNPGSAAHEAARNVEQLPPDRLTSTLLQSVNAGDRRHPLLLPAGSEIVLRPVARPAMAPSGVQPTLTGEEPALPALQSGQRLSVVSMPTQRPGQWILRSALGGLMIELPPALRLPSSFDVEVVEVLPARPERMEQTNLGGLFTHVGDDWPDLRQLLTMPQPALAPTMAKLLPQFPSPGEHTIDKLFRFLAAVRHGTLIDLIDGDVSEILRHELREPLARRLVEDLSELRRIEREQPQQDWRALALPIFDGTHVMPIWVFFKGRRHQSEIARSQGSRFIIELTLSRLGPLQIDGLFRGRRFDLLVRTHRALPVAICGEIEEIFHRHLERSSLTGGMAFQVLAKFPVAPLDALRSRTRTASLAV